MDSPLPHDKLNSNQTKQTLSIFIGPSLFKDDPSCPAHTAQSIFTKFDFLSKHCSQWPDSVMCSTYKKLIPEGAAHFVKVTSQQLYMQSQTLISINIEKPRFMYPSRSNGVSNSQILILLHHINDTSRKPYLKTHCTQTYCSCLQTFFVY